MCDFRLTARGIGIEHDTPSHYAKRLSKVIFQISLPDKCDTDLVFRGLGYEHNISFYIMFKIFA
jgi:hypothetical protein